MPIVRLPSVANVYIPCDMAARVSQSSGPGRPLQGRRVKTVIALSLNTGRETLTIVLIHLPDNNVKTMSGD